MITIYTPILGSGADAYDAFEELGYCGDDAGEYIIELDRLCQIVGLDFRILLAQAVHETDTFRSKWWRERLNPAGIGITGWAPDDEASPTFKNGTDAARGHVTHMALYVYGDWDEMHALSFRAPSAGEPWVTITNELGNAGDWVRYQNVVDAGYLKSVRVLKDLGNGRWATDSRYAEKIVEKANAIFRVKESGDSYTTPEPSKGGDTMPIKQPVIYKLWEDYARFGLTRDQAYQIIGQRFENRRDGSIQGRPTHIMFHIQAGYTPGSLKHWLGVSASSTVMIQRDGSILQVIPEQHGPWTNGDDDAPKPAGQALVDQPGNSNIWTLSMEAEGVTGEEPLRNPAQMDAIEWQARDWMTRYPETAAPGHQLQHADVQRIQKPNCAGAYYPVIMERLKQTPAPPAKPTASPIWWTPGDIGVQIREHDGAKAIAVLGEVTAKRRVPVRKDADSKSPVLGYVEQGKKAKVVGTYRGKNRWVFLEVSPGTYGRALWSAFAERFPTL